MAKKSKIMHNRFREDLCAKYAEKREALRPKRGASIEENFKNSLRLAKLPYNSSPCRRRLRCALTGRPRGVYRRFGLSRIAFRELALQGMIPGVTKSSW